MINKDSSEAMYIQIAEELKQRIGNGVIKSGSRLPSERELGQEYKVSRITIRQAISLLERQGLVHSSQGKGTYVRHAAIRQNLMNVTSFSKTLQERGFKASTVVLSVENSFRESVQFRMRQIPETLKGYSLKILGLGDGNPMVYYHSFLREDVGASMCPLAVQMSKEGKAFSTFDLYERTELHICRIEQELFAENAAPHICSLLKTKDADAVLRLESIIYDSDDQVMECKIGYYRADMYSFRLLRSFG